MLSLIREKRVEIAKLFGALLFFAILQHLDIVPHDYFAGKIVKVLMEVAISVAAVFVISDILLGSPVVRLEWRSETTSRPAIGEILIRGKQQLINLQIKVSGESLLQRVLLHRSKRNHFIIEIKTLPAGAIKLIRQNGPNDFTVGTDRESLIFGKTLLDATRTVAFADFAVKRKAAEGYEHEVTVDVTARWEPKICRLPVTLAKVESGIERLVLEG